MREAIDSGAAAGRLEALVLFSAGEARLTGSVQRRTRGNRASVQSPRSSGAPRRPAICGPDADPALIASAYARRRRCGDLGARRRALRWNLGRSPSGSRGDRRAAPREGLLLDRGAPPHGKGRGRRRGAAPAPRPRRRRRPHGCCRSPRASASTRSSRPTTAPELDRGIALGAPVLGVNARDLATFTIDRRAQLELVARIPADRIVIAESGIATRAQGAAAELAGADAVLVGSTLMRAADPAAKLRELLSRPLVKVCGLTREEDVAAAAEAGADLAGFILVPESPRAATTVLPVPDGMLSVAVWVGEAGDIRLPTSTRCTPSRTARFAGREAALASRRRRGRAPARPALGRDRPGPLASAAAAEGRIVLAGRLGPGERARRRSRRSGPGPSTRPRRSSPRRGSRITTR